MSIEWETVSKHGSDGRRNGVRSRIVAMLRRLRGSAEEGDAYEALPGVSARFLAVDSEAELEATFARSAERPQWLFLNDPWCPVSRRAYDRLHTMDADFSTVDVARHGALSKHVERRTGIRHESPQLILLREGRPAWHASHWRIDPRRAAREMRKAGDGVGSG